MVHKRYFIKLFLEQEEILLCDLKIKITSTDSLGFNGQEQNPWAFHTMYTSRTWTQVQPLKTSNPQLFHIAPYQHYGDIHGAGCLSRDQPGYWEHEFWNTSYHQIHWEINLLKDRISESHCWKRRKKLPIIFWIPSTNWPRSHPICSWIPCHLHVTSMIELT